MQKKLECAVYRTISWKLVSATSSCFLWDKFVSSLLVVSSALPGSCFVLNVLHAYEGTIAAAWFNDRFWKLCLKSLNPQRCYCALFVKYLRPIDFTSSLFMNKCSRASSCCGRCASIIIIFIVNYYCYLRWLSVPIGAPTIIAVRDMEETPRTVPPIWNVPVGAEKESLLWRWLLIRS